MNNPNVDRQLKTPLLKRVKRYFARKFSPELRYEIAQAEEQIYANQMERERSERQMRVLETSIAREDEVFNLNRRFVAERFGMDSSKVNRYLMVINERKLAYHSPLASYVLCMRPERVHLLFSGQCGDAAGDLLSRLYTELNRRAQCFVEFGIDAVDQQVRNDTLVEKEVLVKETRATESSGLKLNMPKYIRGGEGAEMDVPFETSGSYDVTSTKVVAMPVSREVDSNDVAILLSLGGTLQPEQHSFGDSDFVGETVQVQGHRTDVANKLRRDVIEDIPESWQAKAAPAKRKPAGKAHSSKANPEVKFATRKVVKRNASAGPGGFDTNKRGFK
ncbi:hypothetical protein [Vibrio owensii]|uniref:hypothetical protein n=1 Tax=Vibrio owensii TaxID=696485 RepID=UPI0018F24187|nr:hypothetical protein [Vibrio owensii]